MNSLKIKTTISCNTCGISMKRIKTIKVEANTQDSAFQEAKEKTAKWTESLKGKNCKCCQSIINDLAA